MRYEPKGGQRRAKLEISKRSCCFTHLPAKTPIHILRHRDQGLESRGETLIQRGPLIQGGPRMGTGSSRLFLAEMGS